ncbi:Josephin-domain-containing protein [Agrocybe pediades]|nr:Josephin-domain-containing protein [Agrocybe pediades]
MAGLEPLIPYIYHETQQEGSMLCAQHALNNLLQGNYFTAPDLSHIARELDDLEQSYHDNNTGSSSMNMDDTGFFSVQVLDNALKVWGLNLTRWRSEEMRPYQDHPQTQLGFILNLQQHWFTLRRFGNANPNVDLDVGDGHWFNLNSFLPEPEWVGKLYLGMVLQQSEAEGYSVFAVTQADRNAPLGLPRTEADMIASTLPEPTSASGTRPRASRMDTEKTAVNSDPDDMDFANEDLELQAALQASLMASDHVSSPPPASASAPSSSRLLDAEDAPSGSPSPSLIPPIAPISPISTAFGPGHADIDPVAASMERNRVLLQRMREQQEFAQREMWSEEDLSPEEQAALNERRERRRRQEEEEEMEIQRAIAESEALAKQHQQERNKETRPHPTAATNTENTINYDDDDADLQAALKASLEHSLNPPQEERPADADDGESVLSDATSAIEDTTAAAASVAPSLDEIRQRRLARFGN